MFKWDVLLRKKPKSVELFSLGRVSACVMCVHSLLFGAFLSCGNNSNGVMSQTGAKCENCMRS